MGAYSQPTLNDYSDDDHLKEAIRGMVFGGKTLNQVLDQVKKLYVKAQQARRADVTAEAKYKKDRAQQLRQEADRLDGRKPSKARR